MILIDSREVQHPYITRRLAENDIDSEIVCFPQETGCDYLISGTTGSCVIQRKVVCSELISELDEILYDIVPRLKNFAGASGNPCMLIEENFGISKDGYLYNRTDNRETQMLATSYYGFLETIRKMGLDIYCTRDLNASVWWMISLHTYLEKNHYPKHKKYFSIQEQAIGMLTAVPSIGEHRAMKALEKSTICGMCGMKHVDGLTVKQAEKLQKVLRWKVR